MATSVLVIGDSGSGKSTAAETLDPEKTYYINSDGKSLPFKGWSAMYNEEKKNYKETSKLDTIQKIFKTVSEERKHITSIVWDTLNGSMLDIEMSANFRSRKMGGEALTKWMDLAAEVYDAILSLNSLRRDLTIFVLGHTTNYTDVDGTEKRCLVTNGRKLEKIRLETKFPIVLCTTVKYGANGKNEYQFETQANASTAKSPKGLFDSFLIPNDFELVRGKIEEYNNG